MADSNGASIVGATKPALALIGAGKLGGALVRGWVAAGALDPARVRIISRTTQSAQSLATAVGAGASASASDAVAGADVVLVAVKPHLVCGVLDGLREAIGPGALVLSVAAGLKTAKIESSLPQGQSVVRALPNTPAQVGASATAWCRGAHTSDVHAELVQSLFSTVGAAVEVNEAQMDAVVGVSASASAFFYLIIEAITDGGVRAGLPRDIARTLAAQTALGAGRMVLETGLHPAALKDEVTTPGGTTMAGLEALEKGAIRGVLIEAVLAAAQRARELGGSE